MAQVHGRRTWREGQPGIRRPGPHAQVESSSEQWRDAAGSLPTFGIQSHTDACTHVVARALDGADFGPSRNGDGGCAGWRAQYARVWEGDGATAQAVCLRLASGPSDVLHACAWEINVTDSRPLRNGAGTVPGAAHSLRECRGATVRRRKQFAYDTFPRAPMQS